MASHQSSSKARSNGSGHAAAPGFPRAKCARIRAARGGRSSGGPRRRWRERRLSTIVSKLMLQIMYSNLIVVAHRLHRGNSRKILNLEFVTSLDLSSPRVLQYNDVIACVF